MTLLPSRSFRLAVSLLALVACQPNGDSERGPPFDDAGALLEDAGEPQDAAFVDAPAFDPAPLFDRPIFDLTRDEARDVLIYGERDRGTCAGVGIGQRTPQRCEYAQLLCSKTPPQPPAPRPDWPAGAPYKPGCSATVHDYLACRETETRLGCERAGMERDMSTSEACLTFQSKCPTLDFPVPPRPAPTTCPPSNDRGQDIHGFDGCRPKPARLVALGDSIATCTRLANDQPCAPDLLAEYLRAKYTPELRFESYAVEGTHTVDLIEQASYVVPGPGHVLVWVFSGGNDLADCQRESVDLTRSCVDAKIESVPAQWEALFAYFADSKRFPDGATFVLNTQYSLYDGCHAPFGVPGFAEEQIQRFNEAAELAPANARSDTIAIDQLPDWLGHARNAADVSCPHHDANDDAAWLLWDGIHPSELGQCQIAAKASSALDRIYDCGS